MIIDSVKRVRVGLFLGTVAFTMVAACMAQNIVRVESRQVLISVEVWNQYNTPAGLTAKNFRIFEDGKEQKIQNVAVGRDYMLFFRDNLGIQEEWANTPRGKWSRWNQKLPSLGQGSDYYVIAYVPPVSAEGSCHKIKAKVDRYDVEMRISPTEYCNTQHAPTDPLNGTNLSKKMENYAALMSADTRGVSIQSSFFYTDTYTNRADIAIEFPLYTLGCRTTKTAYAIGILGMVYTKDGMVATRFSDEVWCFAPAMWVSPIARYPNRYETQIDLSPGDYDLKIVVGDQWRLVGAHNSLVVDKHDDKQLAISGVTLCKQFHEHATPAAPPIEPFDFVPLVSKGIEFSPAGDTNFAKGDSMVAYFEVYEPQVITAPPSHNTQAHLRVVDAKTGEIKKDFQQVDLSSYMQAESHMIAVSREIPIDQLPPGAYRLEVQASDSAGQATVWQAVNFTRDSFQ